MQQQRAPKSWELRKKDPNKYRCYDVSDQTVIKKPGEIDGEQFVLRNCKKSTIILLDYTATIYIDDCVDCRFFFGPVESSLFIRGSKKCKIVAACGQFRSKKCEDIQLLLFSQSQPIIELSLRMGFGCFRGWYPELAKHMEKAKLKRWNNTWSDIFDFNEEYHPDQQHFYMLLEDTRYDDFLPALGYEGEFKNENQVIPFSSEQRKKAYHEEVLLIFHKQLDFDAISFDFQPLMNEAAQMIFEEEEEEMREDVVIDAPEVLYCYLVKSKWQAMFADNYPPFKQLVESIFSKTESEKILNAVVVDNRLQDVFSMHIRTDNRDVKLLSYLHSLFDTKLKVQLREVCSIVKDKEHIEQIGSLLFANMKDERQGQ